MASVDFIIRNNRKTLEEQSEICYADLISYDDDFTHAVLPVPKRGCEVSVKEVQRYIRLVNKQLELPIKWWGQDSLNYLVHVDARHGQKTRMLAACTAVRFLITEFPGVVSAALKIYDALKEDINFYEAIYMAHCMAPPGYNEHHSFVIFYKEIPDLDTIIMNMDNCGHMLGNCYDDPHVWDCFDCDIDSSSRWRREMKEDGFIKECRNLIKEGKFKELKSLFTFKRLSN